MKRNLLPNVIVALDYDNMSGATALVDQLDPKMCRLKVGKYMFTRFGPEFVRTLVARGFSVFLDLKFHDIPNTVADACVAAAQLGVWMVNVHVLGGVAMMQAARAALDQLPASQRPLLIGVTVLTSLQEADLTELGFNQPLEVLVQQYAQLAKQAGLDGVVCSAQEASLLKSTLGDDFLLVTPGIRFENDSPSDQKRVVTPKAAIAAGADYLVIGRSITQAKNPLAILQSIDREVRNSV